MPLPLYSYTAADAPPGLTKLRLQDARSQNPGGELDFTQDPLDHGWALYVPSLDDAKAARLSDARAELASRLAAGLLVGSLHVAIDAESRSNLQAVVLAAGLVKDGSATWNQQDGSSLPDFRDYARGWISMEGDRIPLATPADGVGLALKVSAYYSALVQREQDLENEINASSDPASVDVTADWPS